MAVTELSRTRAPLRSSTLLRSLAGLVLGGALIVAFLRLVNLASVIHRLAHLKVVPALLCGALFLGAYVVRGLRWRTLLAPDRPAVARVLAIYQVATFLNWLLPVRGGELAKCLLLRRSDGVPFSRSLATVGVDKAMDLLPACVLVALLPFIDVHVGGSLWVLLVVALSAVAAVTAVVAVALRSPERAMTLLLRPLTLVLPRRLADRLEPFLRRFLAALAGVARQPRVLGLACAFTALAVALDAGFCLLAFRAVGVNVRVPLVLYGYTLFNLAFILPTPPGQVGSNELVGLLVFSGMFKLGRAGVAAMFLFSHPWTALLMSTSGMLCLSAMGLSLRGTVALAQSDATGQEA